MRLRLTEVGVIVAWVLYLTTVTAGDWPQILGPQRNGVAAEDEKLLENWPAGGPAVLWQREVGAGYAGPAVVGNEVYVFHRVGDVERLQRLDALSGRELWRTDFEATYGGGVNSDTGPRCVPLVHGSNVYLFGAAGDLHCVSRRSGAKQWSRETYAEFRASEGYFGAGSTPIILGDVLLANVGGQSGAGIVAFSLVDGSIVWKKTDERASYSSPTPVILDGKAHALFVTRYNTLAIDPDSGEVPFRFPFGMRGPTVNAATPLVFDQKLFVTAAYNVGCVMARIDKGNVKVLWANDETLSSHYNTAIRVGDSLYGIHGREDIGPADLRCVDVATGSVRWAEPGFGVAHMILADGKLFMLKVDGTLLLAQPDETRFVKLAEASVSNVTTRALPALAGGRLYLRNNDYQGGTLFCLQVGK